jgi:signal transduction histidine kinase
VFDPFFTTKEPGKGTGLGLAICGRLAEGMGGRMSAENAPEGGARFIIRLPATRQETDE